jgi:hypothetical protein
MKIESLGFSLQDIIFLIGIQARSGELAIESGNNIGTILFHKGKIIQAFSPYSRAIGDLLVEDGLITEAELMETLKLQKQSLYAPLGSLLLKIGKVTFEVIEMMVHEQIRLSMKEFQTWNDLSFSFIDKAINPFDRINLETHEFLTQETIQTIKDFIAREPAPQSSLQTPAPSSMP